MWCRIADRDLECLASVGDTAAADAHFRNIIYADKSRLERLAGGQFVTKPFVFSGKHSIINHSTSAAGGGVLVRTDTIRRSWYDLISGRIELNHNKSISYFSWMSRRRWRYSKHDKMEIQFDLDRLGPNASERWTRRRRERSMCLEGPTD